jgi:hypothetical protein
MEHVSYGDVATVGVMGAGDAVEVNQYLYSASSFNNREKSQANDRKTQNEIDSL